MYACKHVLAILTTFIETRSKLAWFPLDCNGIMKSCDPSRFWLIVKRFITLENKNLIEIGSNLQPNSLILLNFVQ